MRREREYAGNRCHYSGLQTGERACGTDREAGTLECAGTQNTVGKYGGKILESF